MVVVLGEGGAVTWQSMGSGDVATNGPWAVDVERNHAHRLAHWALAMGSTMAGEV